MQGPVGRDAPFHRPVVIRYWFRMKYQVLRLISRGNQKRPETRKQFFFLFKIILRGFVLFDEAWIISPAADEFIYLVLYFTINYYTAWHIIHRAAHKRGSHNE
jgi:hypothetical protein